MNKNLFGFCVMTALWLIETQHLLQYTSAKVWSLNRIILTSWINWRALLPFRIRNVQEAPIQPSKTKCSANLCCVSLSNISLCSRYLCAVSLGPISSRHLSLCSLSFCSISIWPIFFCPISLYAIFLCSISLCSISPCPVSLWYIPICLCLILLCVWSIYAISICAMSLRPVYLSPILHLGSFLFLSWEHDKKVNQVEIS